MELREHINSISGIGIVVGESKFSHSYNTLDYYMIVIRNPRSYSKYYDYFYLYLDQDIYNKYKSSLVEGQVISYEGTLLSTKIEWNMNDISALVTHLELVDKKESELPENESYSTITVTGEVRTLTEPHLNEDGKLVGQGVVVKVDLTDRTYVNIKFTGYGRLSTVVSKLEVGDLVYARAIAQSYPIKGRYAKRGYLHDNRLIAITKAKIVSDETK